MEFLSTKKICACVLLSINLLYVLKTCAGMEGKMTLDEKLALLKDERYPLASGYNPLWIYENQTGSPSLFLAEALFQIMDLQPGMKILDLGCGKALPSVFLAKKFGVQVFAIDPNESVSENWERIQAAGAEELVVPMQGEAHHLPFAKAFFDAVICIDSFQFFGNSDVYLAEYIAPLMKHNGQFGMAFLGPEKEFDGKVPDHMEENWWPEFYYYHSLDWMRWHFEKSRLFTIEAGDDLDGDGVRLTDIWSRITERPLLDQFGIMRWHRMVARKNQWQARDFKI